MSQISEIQDKIAHIFGDAISQMSFEFMELMAGLKLLNKAEPLVKKVDLLFKNWLKTNQQVNKEVSNMANLFEKLTRNQETLQSEKQRLEVLYTSGIIFGSETEKSALMGKAIDTVIKALKADAGFIVLANEAGEINEIFAENMNPEDLPEAKDLSTSVIKNTMVTAKPTQIDDLEKFREDSQKGSILRLGIQSVLCVPLISASKVLGAVYLDKRDVDSAFHNSDLVFLVSFGRQIVQGLEVSQEISLLEEKLVKEVQMDFTALRQQFSCEAMIGSSPALFEVLLMASKISPTNATVILLGESGVGKEILAKALHQNSRRADRPFVAINCGAIPADLLESELFGYEAGAFTGAVKAKPGKMEIADGGTFFLDEIAELDINLQAKLLRVLQTQEIERLGSVKPKKVDLRIIAASNKNLTEMVSQQAFREDLYYRLKVIEITLPALRNRKRDIAPLATFFLNKHAEGEIIPAISAEAMAVLENYDWPGNIRELENVILRGVVLAKDAQITVSDLPSEIVSINTLNPTVAEGKPLAEAESEFRRQYILQTLQNSASKTEAAKKLGVNRTHFHRLLGQLGIDG